MAWYPLEDRKPGFSFGKIHDAVGLYRTRCGMEDHRGRLKVRRPSVAVTCASCLAMRHSERART